MFRDEPDVPRSIGVSTFKIRRHFELLAGNLIEFSACYFLIQRNLACEIGIRKGSIVTSMIVSKTSWKLAMFPTQSRCWIPPRRSYSATNSSNRETATIFCDATTAAEVGGGGGDAWNTVFSRCRISLNNFFTIARTLKLVGPSSGF